MSTEVVEKNSKEILTVAPSNENLENSQENVAIVNSTELLPENLKDNIIENSSIESNEKLKSISSCTSVSGAVMDNDTETISIKCYDRLIEELKCPGCAIPMRPPIRICTEGHSICDKCTKRLNNCPLCKATFTLMRSLTLEALSAKAQFCCSYAAAGCKVRLPLELLDWHQHQCQFKIIKCFMGRVWGGCDWMGRESMWADHLESKHMDKIYDQFPVELEWNINERLTPFAGYYVLNWEGQSFNLYQIFDRENSRILWSMTIAGKLTRKCHRDYTFAYEIEIYSLEDETKVICQRYPCRKEQDKDILQEGTCVAISMADITRFIAEPEKIVNYRVKIHKIKTPVKRLSLFDKQLPVDFKQTNIEGGNHKSVSPDIILTKKIEDECSRSVVASPSGSSSHSKENKEDSEQSVTGFDNLNSDSDSDPELEAFVNDMMRKKWIKNITTPNLNRKFWDDNYSYNESVTTLNMTEINERTRNSLERYEDQDFIGRLKKKNSIKSFREAFKNFRISSNKKKNESE